MLPRGGAQAPGRYHIQGDEDYNIWHDRFMGDAWRKFDHRELSETRCHMEKDCGRTAVGVPDALGPVRPRPR